MKRKEKKERFHDALRHMLYPPPQKEVTPEPPSLSPRDLNLSNLNFPDEFEPSSSGSDEVECDDGPKKLTRAQRKRLRKKKLKETASNRRKNIGPVLPPSEVDAGNTEDQPEGVRENAPETLDAVIQEPDSGRSTSSCLKQSRANKRRKAKNMSNTKLPDQGNRDVDHIPVDNKKTRFN